MQNELDFLKVDKDVLENIEKNREYNQVICNYYYRWASSGGSVAFDSTLLARKNKRLHNCNKFWYNHYYPDHGIKDFQSTTLCKDKNCANCKKVKQSGRMAKYIPFLEPYADSLYHFTLTLPNCLGVDLRDTCKLMAKSFRTLIRILEGRKKIDGLDLTYWGYQGAIRSLEVTFNDKSYHPHYHVCFNFSNFKIEDVDRKEVNAFSYSYGKLTRLFHDHEILIQKIWYLLINQKPVTLKNINNLKEGYSCTIDCFTNNDYAELFKYMTKETKEDGTVLSYNNFIELYYGLYQIKQLQGYGVFYNVTDDSDLDSFEQMYDELIEGLRQIEKPLASYDSPEALINDNVNTLISRKSYFKYLRECLTN